MPEVMSMDIESSTLLILYTFHLNMLFFGMNYFWSVCMHFLTEIMKYINKEYLITYKHTVWSHTFLWVDYVHHVRSIFQFNNNSFSVYLYYQKKKKNHGFHGDLQWYMIYSVDILGAACAHKTPSYRHDHIKLYQYCIYTVSISRLVNVWRVIILSYQLSKGIVASVWSKGAVRIKEKHVQHLNVPHRKSMHPFGEDYMRITVQLGTLFFSWSSLVQVSEVYVIRLVL